MLETVAHIAKKRVRLSEVFQDGRLIWPPQPSPCLVEEVSNTKVWWKEPGRGRHNSLVMK